MAVTSETKQIARRYAQITLAVMQHNKLSGARVTSAARGPRHLSLGTTLSTPRELDKALALSEQIALATRTGSVLSFREGGLLVYQFYLKEKHWKTYTMGDTPPGAIGFAESESLVNFTFEPARPHTAFAGTTGSGKTESIKAALYALAATHTPDELKIVLVDIFDNFGDFDNLAHLSIPRAVRPDDINKAVLYVEGELRDRVQNSDKERCRLVFVVDEAETIFNNNGLVDRLKDMAKTGRQFKVNLILGSQDFKESDLPGVAKELNNRFVGMVQNASISARLTGQAGLEAHKLMGAGDFLHVRGSKTVRFQVSQVAAGDYAGLPRAEIAAAPVIIEDSATEVVANFAESIPDDTGGRPPVEVTPQLLASYYYQWPKVLSYNEAKAAGISRRQHVAVRDFLLEFMREYVRLLKDGLRGFNER